MREAVLIKNDEEIVMGAEQARRLIAEGTIRRNAKWICYRCRQRVNPAAMGSDYLVSPHFKHEKNNSQAQECELYETNGGSASSCFHHRQYAVGVMPMYIQEEQGGSGLFEIGFELDALGEYDQRKAWLVADGARLVVAGEAHYCSKGSFPYVDVKIPCPATLCPGDLVVFLKSLKSTHPLNLRDVWDLWGEPEDAERFLVFSHNERMRKGSMVDFGADLLIASPRRSRREIARLLPTACLIGSARSRKYQDPFDVFSLQIDKTGYDLTNGFEALVDEGFVVASLPGELCSCDRSTAVQDSVSEFDESDMLREEPREILRVRVSHEGALEDEGAVCDCCGGFSESDGLEFLQDEDLCICSNCLRKRDRDESDWADYIWYRMEDGYWPDYEDSRWM